MYQVIKNGHVKQEFESKYEAIDFARCLMAEGFTGSILVQKNSVIVFSEQN